MAPDTYGDVIARNIRAARSRAGLSQQSLAERMRVLGFGAWLYQTVGNVEKGRRRVTAEEVLGLAICMSTTVSRLMTPLWEDKWVDLPSGASLRVGAVVTLVTGELAANDSIPTSREFQWHGNKLARAIVPPHEVEDVHWNTPTEEAQLQPVPEPPATKPQRPAVITAIVTSPQGVLVGKRNDGKPPWTFIAGENEPGESPADTIVREVKEETGLEIIAGDILGERVHPKTKRHMVYVAARPARNSYSVIVGDPEELGEVRWASLAEADELLPGMFEPVREHLAQALGEE